MISSKYHLPNHNNTNKVYCDENTRGARWETDGIDINSFINLWNILKIFIWI